MNRNIGKNNTSGAVGVNWNKQVKKWRATISINGTSIHLGYFVSLSDAIIARKNAEVEYFGEFQNKDHTINEATIKINEIKMKSIQNSLGLIKSKSGIKGVVWNKKNKKWVATIVVNSKKIYLGSFSNFDDAIDSRNKAEWQYLGKPNSTKTESQKIKIAENRKIETSKGSQKNPSIQKNNTSGTKGVSFCNTTKRWKSYIRVNKETHWLGNFKDIEDAISARKEAEIKYGIIN